MPEDTQTPIEVFCSYAQQDASWFERLKAHLSLLERQKVISIWHHPQVVPGTDWADTVQTRLNSASIILLLISPDFLASDQCFGVEMKLALQRQQANEARVIPILLRSVYWEEAPFARLQVLPTNAKAITLWENKDEAFEEVVAGIRRSIGDLSPLSIRPPHSSFPPIWNVPYPRNFFFTGRDQLLTRLDVILSSDQASVQPLAITGSGGIGKTQLVVEYAYRYHKRYQAVFWVQGDTRESLISAFVDAAQLLNLPKKDEHDQNVIVAAFQYWMRTQTDWLLILDNADDWVTVSKFIPTVYGGHILLTTRTKITSARAQNVEVKMMAPELAALFLLRRVAVIEKDASLEQASPTDRNQALDIAYELGYLPLALDQAGAYIEDTKFGLGPYLQLYRQEQAALLAHHSMSQTYLNSVATTLSLSFQSVERIDPAAADLLRFCAFLHPDAIPEEIITGGAAHLGSRLASIAHNALTLNSTIAVLLKYSLISRATEGDTHTLSVHRLVQVVLEHEMDAEERVRWAERCVKAVNAAFPEIETDLWINCGRYLLHAQMCFKLIKQSNMTFPEATGLLTKLGWYLKEHARYEEAEPIIQYTLDIINHSGRPQHIASAQLFNILAEIYISQGRYAEAEPLLLQAQTSYEQLLESNHRYTLRTLNNLASLYCAQGKYLRAEPLYQRTLTLREQRLGRDDSDTASSLNNLAACYGDLGKYDEAEPLMLRALAIYEHIPDPNGLMTAVSCNNLAELYIHQKKYNKAEPLCLRAIAIYKHSFGDDHPDTANSLNTLAGVYCETGRYSEAESLYQQALTIYEKRLGHDHRDTANGLNNLASLYCKMHQYDQAESLLKRALDICQLRLEYDHPDTINTLYNLARLFHIRGDFDQALPRYQLALDRSKQHLGPDHLDTIKIREKYYDLRQAMGTTTRQL